MAAIEPSVKPDVPGAETVQLILLRHAHVDGHRGDVPITDRGAGQARRAGEWLAQHEVDVCAVLYGGTRRSRETAHGLIAGLGERAEALQPTDSFALRNPDLYLGGERVSMVSSAESFAEQTAGVRPEDVTAIEFYRAWLEHPDRVGFWVDHTSPPGDDARSVGRRISSFASSLADVRAWRGRTVVAVTHSPVLRSVGVQVSGSDRGEPAHVTGYSFIAGAGEPVAKDLTPATS